MQEILDVYSYIKRCLDQYYQRPVTPGKGGDFVTSPHLTPLFGYLIAYFCLESWRQAGSPLPIRLIECGPGTGQMMRDMVTVFKTDPVFYKNLEILFVDRIAGPQTVPSLRDIQPKGFLFVIGNEFLDALPIQQYVIHNDLSKKKRYVAKQEDGTWGFVTTHGVILEECPDIIPIMHTLNQWLEQCPGTVLWIDYGDDTQERYGDTLQGIFKHQRVSPFFKPGETDLSHHVNFSEIKKLAKHPCTLTTQADFLTKWGLETWLLEMEKIIPEEQMTQQRLSALRLIHPQEMGVLFKVFEMRSF